MDIKNSEDKLKQVDSFLTTLTNLLKKHWIILSVMTLIIVGYWMLSTEEEGYAEEDAEELVPDTVYIEYEEDTSYYEE